MIRIWDEILTAWDATRGAWNTAFFTVRNEYQLFRSTVSVVRGIVRLQKHVTLDLINRISVRQISLVSFSVAVQVVLGNTFRTRIVRTEWPRANPVEALWNPEQGISGLWVPDIPTKTIWE